MTTYDQEALISLAIDFNVFGWIILVLVIGYNFTIILAMLVDLWRDCWRGGNLSVMDEIRREYYWEKINQYECENKDI